MRRRPRWILPLLVLLAIGAAIVWAFLPRPIAVDAARVVRGPLRMTVDEDGRTRIRERYVVTAPLSGWMQRIELHAGDPIDTGARVTTITPTAPALLDVRDRLRAEAGVSAAESALQQAQATVERARETADYTHAEATRRTAMSAKGAVSRQELEDWVHRERVAAAELRSAELAARVAAFELEQAKAVLVHVQPVNGAAPPPPTFDVNSPVSGRVLRLIEENAGVVAAGTRLVEIGDPKDLEVEVDVLSRDAVRIPSGAKVIFEQWGGERPLVGRVRHVEPAGFTKVSALGIEEQRVNVIIDFVAQEEERKPLGDAFRVEARIVLWENADALKVPAGSLFRHGERWSVFAIANGRASLRPVETGHSDGIETEVLGGLAEGDLVILHPTDRVSDGVAIEVR